MAGKAEQIFVAEPIHEPGLVVGFIQVLERIFPESAVSRLRSVAQIEALVVTTATRRGGVARVLVGAAEQWARERGLSGIELNVWAGNQIAVDAYKAMGFETLSYRLFRIFKS